MRADTIIIIIIDGENFKFYSEILIKSRNFNFQA